MKFKLDYVLLLVAVMLQTAQMSCKKKGTPETPIAKTFQLQRVELDGALVSSSLTKEVGRQPKITLSFSAPLDRAKVLSSMVLGESATNRSTLALTFLKNDSVLVVTPEQPLKGLTKYQFNISSSLEAADGSKINGIYELIFQTGFDAFDKFPQLTDDKLLDTVQRRTFAYFWEFGHPVSGLARERNTSEDIVTSGGSGFGIMTIPIAIERNFITKGEGLERMKKIVGFLKNTAQRFHGAFPHWLNGRTGTVIPFSQKDNGADLVETSYLIAGLLTAREYFTGNSADEIALRNDINSIWESVEWSWFRKNGENALYWHWSTNFGWDMNMKIQGWNECLITYILAASSPTYGVPKEVYDQGFARSGGHVSNQSHYGFQLPLGPSLGGPLFWSHYSFLGVNPFGLKDAYANYEQQVVNHSKINFSYCVENPKKFPGYSNLCWGLTASDIPNNGYAANAPGNDIGVITPTAAISSLPYTPKESMDALKFFYYKLGDKLWGPYGFYDAFSFQDLWFASSTLAIDQGPIVIMIENHRTQLIWNLFTKSAEIKTGMRSLGFTAPYL
jgi:hypothetical protein